LSKLAKEKIFGKKSLAAKARESAFQTRAYLGKSVAKEMLKEKSIRTLWT
jgi:hypothetical protein